MFRHNLPYSPLASLSFCFCFIFIDTPLKREEFITYLCIMYMWLSLYSVKHTFNPRFDTSSITLRYNVAWHLHCPNIPIYLFCFRRAAFHYLISKKAFTHQLVTECCWCDFTKREREKEKEKGRQKRGKGNRMNYFRESNEEKYYSSLFGSNVYSNYGTLSHRPMLWEHFVGTFCMYMHHPLIYGYGYTYTIHRDMYMTRW